jgi:hypothetical protein
VALDAEPIFFFSLFSEIIQLLSRYVIVLWPTCEVKK